MVVNPSVIESELNDFNTILNNMDSQLSGQKSKFFGNMLSLADILYYWEISTI